MAGSALNIRILRRTGPIRPPAADANVVVDVLRAFTTAHVAFQKGVESILLAGEVEEARAVKARYPDYLLVGEGGGGVPVPGFDFGNSPSELAKIDLTRRKIIFRTSNGTKATLEALDARYVMVAAMVNARATAVYLRERPDMKTINLIASAEDDDDFACAEYIAGLLDPNAFRVLPADAVSARIHACRTAKKFRVNKEGCFPLVDLELAASESENAVPLRVIANEATAYHPQIERTEQ